MKRNLLTLLPFMLCMTTYAQTPEIDSVKKYLQLDKDKFTDKSNVVPISKTDGKTVDGFNFTMSPAYNLESNFISINFICSDIGCVNEKNEINYLFEDKSKESGYHYLNYNCQGVFTSVYKSWVAIEPIRLLKFTITPISMIRLSAVSKSTEIQLSKQQGLLILNQIKWLKYYWDNKKKLTKLGLFI